MESPYEGRVVDGGILPLPWANGQFRGGGNSGGFAYDRLQALDRRTGGVVDDPLTKRARRDGAHARVRPLDVRLRRDTAAGTPLAVWQTGARFPPAFRIAKPRSGGRRAGRF
jgi:hypothetical protein